MSTLAALLLGVYLAGALSTVRSCLASIDGARELLDTRPLFAFHAAAVALWPLLVVVVAALRITAAVTDRYARRPL